MIHKHGDTLQGGLMYLWQGGFGAHLSDYKNRYRLHAKLYKQRVISLIIHINYIYISGARRRICH